jgi:hypothetical protein
VLTIATDAPFVGIGERAGTLAIVAADCCATAVAGGTTAVARVVAKFATAVARGVARNPAIAVSLEFGLRWKDVIRSFTTGDVAVDVSEVTVEDGGDLVKRLAAMITNCLDDVVIVG